MTMNKLRKPTTYVVLFWNEDDSKIVREEAYPMHIYSLEEVFLKLKGKKSKCDIYEGRYLKNRGKYITAGKTYVWVNFSWTILT